MHDGSRADRTGCAERVTERIARPSVDLAGVKPRSLMTATACAANASFNSIQPRSSLLMPADFRAPGTLLSTDAHDFRRHTPNREAAKRTRGVRLKV